MCCLNIWTGSARSYIQQLFRGGIGSPIQLFSCDVLHNWFDFNVFTHYAKQFRLRVPEFIMAMALDGKSAPFAYHSVIHIENVPANKKKREYQELPTRKLVSKHLETHSSLHQSYDLKL